MFKVICIDAKEAPELMEGNPYTVIQTFIHPVFHNMGYLLQEVKSDRLQCAFKAIRFMPISSISELSIYSKSLMNEN